MGGNQGAIFQQGEPLTNYDVIQKVPEHNISYLKHKTNSKEYMIREFAINDKTQFAQTTQKIKNRKKMESPYLTKLERFSEQLEDNMCSSFYKIYAMWEYPTHTLADQINERALQKRRFQQNELFSIIASIIEGMSCLQSSGVKHECLNTSTILFDQTGIVKVADPLTSIAPSNFDRINTNRKAKSVYISPEQCESLKNQRPIPNRNPYKSDVFILGVIMLECGLLEPMESIFVQNFEDIDLEEVNEKLDLFGKIYSKDLKLTVSTMLTRDPKERMDWIGLKQYVPQKNEADGKQNLSPGNSLGYKSEIPFQPLQQQPGKLMLGGGIKVQSAQGGFGRQPVLNSQYAKFQPQIPKYQAQVPKFQVQIPKYQPQPLKPQAQQHYTYGSTVIQPSSTHTFGQSIQSFGYQPATNFSSSNFASSTTNYGYSGLGSNLYSNQQKVSNYIVESKPSYERPTEQFLTNNASKLNPVVPATLADRETSSFPLNSQLEFKKNYLTGISTNFNPPAYDFQSSTVQFSSGKNPIYTQHFNHFTAYSALNPTVPSAISPSYVPAQSKSFANNQKTQVASSQGHSSPLQSQHVKDAKSITYDKNLYSSYITEEKGNSYAVQQEGSHHAPNHYSTIVTTSNHEPAAHGINGNQYQSINKPTVFGNIQQEHFQQVKTFNHSVPSTAPLLYQPLSSVGFKEKPNIPTQPPTNYANESQRSTHTNVFMNTATIVSPQSTQEAYQYRQIQPQGPSSQPSSASQLNQSSVNQQELEYVIEHFKQGSRYEGTKLQDMRHGQGKFFYQDGGMYEGNWRFNKMDGFGKLYYQSGKIAYEGNWNEDQFQGFGKLYNEECDQLQEPFDYGNFDMIDEFWVFYEGNFVADEKNGEGKMVFSNGEQFVGNFDKDMIDGPGEFYRMNGEVVRGIWRENQLVQFEE